MAYFTAKKNLLKNQLIKSHLIKKKTFDFKIAGVSYKIKTSHDEKTVQDLVDIVNLKVNESLKVTKNNSFQNAAILAALSLAEENILLKKKALAELEKLELSAEKLVLEIENSKIIKSEWS